MLYNSFLQTMPDYQNGKIYQIVGPDGLKYIGSTTRPLSIRFSYHKCDYNRHVQNKKIMRSTCIILFEKFPHELLKIELIENYPCNTLSELNKREGEIIRANKCVNKRIEGRTSREYIKDTIEMRKINYIKNIDQYKKRDKEIYIKNREEIKERVRLYTLQNREAINKRKRELRLLNKDIINKKQREYMAIYRQRKLNVNTPDLIS